MDFWIRATQLILSLSILVALHELGHFIPAKLFKTRVEKFYLFFNPWFSLFRYKKVNGKGKTSWISKDSPKEWKEDEQTTEWGVGWLPLGGYVKIAGMVDESMDKEQLAKPAQPWEFRSKPAWQRLIIMLGGVTVNLFLGILIYILVVFSYGEEKIMPEDLQSGMAVHPFLNQYGIKSGDIITHVNGKKTNHALDVNAEVILRGKRNFEVKHADGSVSTIKLPEDIDYKLFKSGAFPAFNLRTTSKKVDSIIPGTPADLSRLKKGDEFIAINDCEIIFFDDIQAELYRSKNKKANLTVLRGNDTVNLVAKVSESGSLGFVTNQTQIIDTGAVKTVHYGFFESIGKGWNKGFTTLTDYTGQLKFLFTQKGAESLGGFGSIGKMFPTTWNWQIFWLNTAFISIVLAFMNILPIPALDGGHVVFLIYEIITGKEAPQKVLEYAQYVGFILLLGLLIYANGNDIYNSFIK
jgi:regulator of sigma E protease